MVVSTETKEDAQADGILRYMLERQKASRKQVAWLLGYLRRLRNRVRPQDGNSEQQP